MTVNNCLNYRYADWMGVSNIGLCQANLPNWVEMIMPEYRLENAESIPSNRIKRRQPYANCAMFEEKGEKG